MRTKNELYQEALRTVAARRQLARARAEDARAEAEAAVPALRHAEDEVRVYNIFDTEKFLNRPVICAVSNTSGLAGIAHWINAHYGLKDENAVDKNSPLVHEVKKWVDQEYADGRVTVLTDEELTAVIDDVCRRLSISLSGKAASGNGARENGKKETGGQADA